MKEPSMIDDPVLAKEIYQVKFTLSTTAVTTQVNQVCRVRSQGWFVSPRYNLSVTHISCVG